ncbi:MAG: hypothetical protein VX466_14860, partial [Myxococcota bacterium]|nr:hypothetical protein [Myxococcota bacterium]
VRCRVATAAQAGSALVFSPPHALGPLPAGTYDDDGKRLGEATLYYERMPDGKIHMRAATSMQDGPRNLVNAVFEEIDGGRALRVLREDSLSHDKHGKPMVLVEVDHEKGVARCTPPGASEEAVETIPLPENDRVANTTLGLLFQPLVHRQLERIEFQAFLCRGGARLVDFVAQRAERSSREPSDQVVEIRFGPKLGRVLSWLAAPIVPKLRFWFDATEGQYLAHRVPVYGGGPEVVIAREGVAAAALPR